MFSQDEPARLTGACASALKARLCLGITGHRDDNPQFAARRARIEVVLARILDLIDAAVAEEARQSGLKLAPTRLHCLLADGADQMAAEAALARGWELIAPLPFGLALNVAIAAQPATLANTNALLSTGPLQMLGPELRESVECIHRLAARARLFELADQDDAITALMLAKLQHPEDRRSAQVFDAEVSLRVALANRVMVEQSDFLIAIWDGTTRALIGGTGHTIQVALEHGAAVVWIDADAPEQWRILAGHEALAGINADAADIDSAKRIEALHGLVHAAVGPAAPRGHGVLHGRSPQSGAETLAAEPWPVASRPLRHLYRRVEALFGEQGWRRRFRSLRQVYETPESIAGGSAAGMLAAARALPAQDDDYVAAIESQVLRRFAWADGISANLSDTWRGGMTANFLLGALAVVGGIAYLPFSDSHHKWLFASFEWLVLAAILAFTLTGRKRRWHGRWFETRRVAEYLRHAPILLLLGVARAPGRWPVGTQTSWPEWYARHSQRELGLPRLNATPAWLRAAVRSLLHEHVVTQRNYHIAKAQRLAAVHHNLDRCSEILFTLAVASVTFYLVLKVGGALHFWPKSAADTTSYLFTFLGVLLPTFGGAIAGIRYFGDFERFAAISSVTAEKLQSIHARAILLLAAPDSEFDYRRVADMAHAMDEVVVSEIESWQAVFGGKNVTVPV
ncbi:MAG: hypothetical protein ABIQ86_15480 [Steroidobacteraceae bacterium]